jgi:hypothetical protein
MDWFNETALQLMLIAICGLAMWSRNTAAMVYAFLAIAHDQLFQSYAGDASLSSRWAYSAAIFSFLSIAGCVYYRNGVYDDTAYFLAGISAITLALNIWTLYSLLTYIPTEVLNPVFAAINGASILVIAAGGRRDRRRTNIYRNTFAYRAAVKRRRVADTLVLSKETKT